MWTPKRIVLLVIGLVVFIGVYLGYAATSIGSIDGLPPLPDELQPPREDDPVHEKKDGPKRRPYVDLKLEEAFGAGCKELEYQTKLALPSRNMVLATDTFRIIDEGRRASLQPLSLALFGKKKGSRGIEINTIRSQFAILTFDRPVTSPSEVGSRRIVKAELNAQINVVNNRRTPQRSDDLELHIHIGPLYYIESQQLIWTPDKVEVTDHQSRPNPSKVYGEGMKMDLLTEPKPVPAGQVAAGGKKSQGESVTGVKRIVLDKDVVMFLYTRSGFLKTSSGNTSKGSSPGLPASTAPPATAAPLAKDAGRSASPPTAVKPAPAAKDADAKNELITIRTPGPFHYDFGKTEDVARFDLPVADPAHPPASPQDVEVDRLHEDGSHDQLFCHHLEMHLRHKGSTPAPAAAPATPASRPAAAANDSTDNGLDIETAHAWRDAGELTLSSDSEKLSARGIDLFHDAHKGLTVLKGGPVMEAERDGSLIRARELHMQEVKLPPRPAQPATPGHPARPALPARTYQHVTAIGPGDIHMLDKQKGTSTLHAYWNEKLISTKDGDLDLLILTGAARFRDEEHEQSLDGETLKVWLNPADNSPTGQVEKRAGAKDDSPAKQARRPQHLEAIVNVEARSPEIVIHNTGRLVVWFQDIPPPKIGAAGLPGAAPSKPARGPAAPAAPAGDRNVSPTTGGSAALAAAPGASGSRLAAGPAPAAPGLNPNPAAGGKAEKSPPRPIYLRATSVESTVFRCAEKNTLEKLWAEGGVEVNQDAAKPDENGIKITGATLDMRYRADGNLLTVTGPVDLAYLSMNKTTIVGPVVNIDQATNEVWVEGIGGMLMQSRTNFQGDELAKDVPLDVKWQKQMYFNGKHAEFHGDVTADQENSHLMCLHLQVNFDRPISLKEGERNGPQPHVQTLLADKSVQVVDHTYDKKGKLVKHQLVGGVVLSMTALEREEGDPFTPGQSSSNGNLVTVSGPGFVRIVQAGGADPMAPPPQQGRPRTPAAAPPPQKKPGANDDGLKLTYVTFADRMNADSKRNKASFWTNIRVLHMPVPSPNVVVDINKVVTSRVYPEGAMFLRCERLTVWSRRFGDRNNQEMEAHDNVIVRSNEFSAKGDSLYYNEAKDQIILTSRTSNGARLDRFLEPGGPPQTVTGKTIIYNRSTGKVDGDQIENIQGHQNP